MEYTGSKKKIPFLRAPPHDSGWHGRARAREAASLSLLCIVGHAPLPIAISFVRSFEVTFVRFISSGQGRDSEEGKEEGRKEGRKEGREARQTGHGRQKGEGRRGAQKNIERNHSG